MKQKHSKEIKPQLNKMIAVKGKRENHNLMYNQKGQGTPIIIGDNVCIYINRKTFVKKVRDNV